MPADFRLHQAEPRSPTASRWQLDPAYNALLGVAMHTFAVYEWTLIRLITHFDPGFVEYCAKQGPLSSEEVHRRMVALLDGEAAIYPPAVRFKLAACGERFALLFKQRDALLHPRTTIKVDKADRTSPEIQWPFKTVRTSTQEFEAAATDVYRFLQSLLAPPAPSCGIISPHTTLLDAR